MRRLPLAIACIGLLVAALVVPAEAQPNPSITVSPTEAQGGPASENWSLQVRGANFSPGPVAIFFAGEPQTTANPASDGTFVVLITPAKRNAGTYVVESRHNPCAPQGSCPVIRQAFFRSVPRSAFNNPCGPAGSAVSMTVTGTYFDPRADGAVVYDPEGPDRQSHRAPSTSGAFSVTFTVKVPSRTVVIQVFDSSQNQAPDLVWRPAPCPTTTTSTSTPDSTPDTTTSTATVPGRVETTTTSRPPDPPGPAVTVPPSAELPPATPGATLTVLPELGPAGFVTGVTGTGFPPGPVELVWQPGIGRTMAVAAPDGTFTARVLVLPNDRVGPRALVATAGATTAYDAFLVVPSSVQPSGPNVNQINRIRRFHRR